MSVQVSEILKDRDKLAQYFEELGLNSSKLSEDELKHIRYAFIFGQLCKEVEIIYGRKLFE